jgi:hypothetical protein
MRWNILAVAAVLCSSYMGRADEPTKPAVQPVDIEKSSAKVESPAAKDRLQKAMRGTAEALRSRTVEPAERASFVELLYAAEALKVDESVPLHEREKWRGLARVRLVEGADAMRRQLAKEVQAAAAPASSDAHVSKQFPAGGGGAFGGFGAAAAGPQQQKADVVEAEKLIEIITTTIRPETWDVNGGQGVIKYWSLGGALIIYNSADVHERIGGFTGQLRP